MNKPEDKICTSCNILLPLFKFPARGDTGVYRSKCKPCINAYHTKYMKTHTKKPDVVLRMREYSRTHRKEYSSRPEVRKRRRDYRKRKTEFLLSIGRCFIHPDMDAIDGRKHCQDCLWTHILRYHKIPRELADKKLIEQDFTCPLSGRPLIRGINTSVDHIEHVGKYRKDKSHALNNIENIRFVDTQINTARGFYNDSLFIAMCFEVVRKNSK